MDTKAPNDPNPLRAKEMDEKGQKTRLTELKSLGIKYSSGSGILSVFKWLIFQ